MPEYLHPGVYIEETSYRAKPIQGVSTSTAGFVGACTKGVEGRATLVTSMGQFRRRFGEPISPPENPGDYLGHSVKAFFDNGGKRVYIVRALAANAAASTEALLQGTILRLADGVTVRGPTRIIPLNTLRRVEANTVLRIHQRAGANEPFVAGSTLTVESYDAGRNRITVIPGDEIADGTALEPENTYFTIEGLPVPTAGATFTAKNRGVDGDNISIHIRPTDLPPVAITVPSVNRNQPVVATITGAVGAADTTLEISSAGLRRLRSGDQIEVGTADVRTISSIEVATLDYTLAAGPAVDHSAGGGTISLLSRGGSALAVPLELGNIPAGAFDLTAPLAPEANFPHNAAATLEAGDVIRLETGPDQDDLNVVAVTLSQDVAAGQHVTLDAAVGADLTDPPVRLIETDDSNPDYARLVLADVSGFTAPFRLPTAEGVSVGDGTNTESSTILLVDAATNSLIVSKAAVPGPDEFSNAVTAANFTTVEALQVATNGTDRVPVASTGSFYPGAVVELDTSTEKHEMTVASVDAGARTVTFTAPLPLAAGDVIEVDPDPAARATYLRTAEIEIQILEGGINKETFTRLTWSPDNTVEAFNRNYIQRLNDPEIGSDLVTVTAAPAPGGLLEDQPTTAWGFPQALSGGSNGDPLGDVGLIGTDNGPGQRTGIQALWERDDISIVAVPGVVSENVQAALITHCENQKYRIAVLDMPQNTPLVSDLQSHRNNYDTKYAAMYAPWLKTMDLSNGQTILVPPCGHVAGIYARTDNTVGVHKAPANEVVRNITDVEFPFTAGEQDVLNPIGVNLIRDLTPRAIRVWGARTITSDQEWKYVNVRRLFIFLEHSIDLGTQWVVFEPNSEALWARVTGTITAFLTSVWKSGALMGTKPEEAFFVTCDRSTMTQDDLDNGRLICEVGVAPVMPAEFVIFRIGQFTATST